MEIHHEKIGEFHNKKIIMELLTTQSVEFHRFQVGSTQPFTTSEDASETTEPQIKTKA